MPAFHRIETAIENLTSDLQRLTSDVQQKTEKKLRQLADANRATEEKLTEVGAKLNVSIEVGEKHRSQAPA